MSPQNKRGFMPFSQNTNLFMTTTATIEAEIRQAENDWIAIYARNDADAFAPYLTDDFVYTSPMCEVVNRADYLQNLRDKTVVMDYTKVSDLLVRSWGDVAVVTAAWLVKEAYRGTPFEGLCRITRVWLKQEGRWRAHTFQVTECRPQ